MIKKKGKKSFTDLFYFILLQKPLLLICFLVTSHTHTLFFLLLLYYYYYYYPQFSLSLSLSLVFHVDVNINRISLFFSKNIYSTHTLKEGFSFVFPSLSSSSYLRSLFSLSLPFFSFLFCLFIFDLNKKKSCFCFLYIHRYINYVEEIY